VYARLSFPTGPSGAGWLFSFGSNPALAPEPALLVGTYRLTYQIDSTNPAKRSDIFYLLLGKTLSKFQSRGEQANDSLAVLFDALPLNNENAQLMLKQWDYLPHSRFHYNIYKIAASHQVYHYDHITTTSYRYEEPANSLNWTITPTIATVVGYACQRATASYGGRQWEAWFTREVPVSEGPYKFYGLPGLIVKVSDTRQHYVFELAKLTKPATERLITLPKKTPITTDRTTFRRALAAYNADPVGYQAGANDGTVVTSTTGATPDQLRQRARENARKRNNALELR
jgi:GLPGLI family protein